MDKRKLLIVFLLLVVLVNGCAPVVNNELPRKKSISERMKEKTQDVKEPPVITPLAPPPPVVKQKRVVKVNPLKGKIITVNAINESLSKVLFMIAADTGMNLVVSPEIDINARITLNLNEIPADQALDILMDTAGVYYEVEGSVLRIKSLVTIEYRIPYIKAIAQYESKLGGDIVGGAADNDSISGSFSLSYKNDAARNDVYGTIAEHINKIIFLMLLIQQNHLTTQGKMAVQILVIAEIQGQVVTELSHLKALKALVKVFRGTCSTYLQAVLLLGQQSLSRR